MYVCSNPFVNISKKYYDNKNASLFFKVKIHPAENAKRINENVEENDHQRHDNILSIESVFSEVVVAKPFCPLSIIYEISFKNISILFYIRT